MHSDILPPDSLATAKLQPAKTFEDLLRTPTIDNLEAVGDFPASLTEAVQPSARDLDMEKKKNLIKEALERAKTNRGVGRDPLSKVALSKEAEMAVGNLEAPPTAAKKVPPKKDDSHANLSPPLDIIAPTIGR